MSVHPSAYHALLWQIISNDMRRNNKIKDIYLFDWGDTLMVDTPGIAGKMCDWGHVERVKFAEETLKKISLKASVYVATDATESTPEDIEKAFKRVGLDKYIKGYFCKQNTGFTKPEPEFYQAIIDILIPVRNSIKFAEDIRSSTSGRAFWQNTFHAFLEVPTHEANKLISDLRFIKGLSW